MKALLIISLVFLSFSQLFAQNCNCCTPHQQAFDFWVGDWVVYDTTGIEIGKNSIVKLESGCILNEHWRGSKGSTGRSYNYFDQNDSTWNQLWIDNKGNNLQLKGRSTQPNTMTLKSNLKSGSKGLYYDKITWTKISKNEVVQLWETFREDDTKIAQLFKGVYRRE